MQTHFSFIYSESATLLPSAQDSEQWEDQDIYNDPENIRQQALKMGANILQYVFAN